MNRPAFTLVYNISSPGSAWVGTGWEFFDDSLAANTRMDILTKNGRYCLTCRPYFAATDEAHLGAAHKVP